MHAKNKSKVKMLYVKELGPGKQYEIDLLRTLPWVEQVIVADYRYKVGNDAENSAYLTSLKQRWDAKNPVDVQEAIKYLDVTLKDLVNFYLNQADCIFVAGSAYDPSAEYCTELPTRITPDSRREQFELLLIKSAKERGIPLLAVCAGSWRLASAYGAKTMAIAESEVQHHEQWGPVRDPDKLTYLKPGTMLHGIHVAAQKHKQIIFSDGKAQKTLSKNPEPNLSFAADRLHVNTTHWRVTVWPSKQDGAEFKSVFEPAAIDAEHNTLEGYESLYGAPIMGVQFHPEYVIPHVRKSDGSTAIVHAYKTHRSIIEALVESGLTFHSKRELMPEIRRAGTARGALRARL